MARKLKTYTTSIGFFELAVAAPSMKAALEAWRSGRNLFHGGLAAETDDPAAVAATTARPGVVLKRPIGSKGPFKEQAEPPKTLPIEPDDTRPTKPTARKAREKEVPAPKGVAKAGDRAARKVVVDLDKERRRRERERRRDERAREKAERAREQQRRLHEQVVAKAEAALERAADAHAAKMHSIERQRAALDRRAQAEEARWEKQKEKLKADLRRTRASAN